MPVHDHPVKVLDADGVSDMVTDDPYGYGPLNGNTVPLPVGLAPVVSVYVFNAKLAVSVIASSTVTVGEVLVPE